MEKKLSYRIWLVGSLAVSALLALGWLVDRNALVQHNQKLRSKITSSTSNSTVGVTKLSFSEADRQFLARWFGKHAFFRTVHRHRSFQEGLNSEFSNFDQAVNFELIHCVSEAFLQERNVKRLDLSPDAIEVAQEAIEFLGCRDQNSFWEMASELGFKNAVYEHFEDKNSEKHSMFVAFLDRVFLDERKGSGRID